MTDRPIRKRQGRHAARRYMTVLVSFTMLLHGGFAPLLSLASASANGEAFELVEICTSHGTKIVMVPVGGQGAPLSGAPSESCDACVCGVCGCASGPAGAWARVYFSEAGEALELAHTQHPPRAIFVAANACRGPPPA